MQIRKIIVIIILLLLLPAKIIVNYNLVNYEIYNLENVKLLAKLINSESHKEDYIDKLRVGSVVLNRLMDPKFPKTIKEVIFQKNQFSGINNELFSLHPNRIKDFESIKAAKFLLKNGSILPLNVLYFHNPKLAKNSKWICKLKKLYCKSAHHHYFIS